MVPPPVSVPPRRRTCGQHRARKVAAARQAAARGDVEIGRQQRLARKPPTQHQPGYPQLDR